MEDTRFPSSTAALRNAIQASPHGHSLDLRPVSRRTNHSGTTTGQAPLLQGQPLKKNIPLNGHVTTLLPRLHFHLPRWLAGHECVFVNQLQRRRLRRDTQEASEAILQMFTASPCAVLSFPLADKHERQHKQIHLKVTVLKQHSAGKLRTSSLAILA